MFHNTAQVDFGTLCPEVIGQNGQALHFEHADILGLFLVQDLCDLNGKGLAVAWKRLYYVWKVMRSWEISSKKNTVSTC